MSWIDALLIITAGFAAGTINTIVGSGSLITFPTLLALGYSPVVANVTNTVGLVPGSTAGAIGYRRELAGQGPRLVRLGSATLLGALAGGLLLLRLPGSVFDSVVPALIALACVLVLIQPWLVSRLKVARPHHRGGPLVWVAVFLAGVYGGYFGAAQGVILIAVLALSFNDGLQRANAAKNVLAGLANLVAGLLFILVADVDWLAALLIAVGAAIGGVLGARIGRRLPSIALRIVVVVIGILAMLTLL